MLKVLRRISFGHLIGGVLLTLIGVALAVVFVRFSYQDFTIWFFGKEVTGTVDRTYYEFVGGRGRGADLRFLCGLFL